MHPSQIVQARMWAQGLTIGTLIAGGVATSAQRAQAFKDAPFRHNKDHSWEDIVQHEEMVSSKYYIPQRLPKATH